MTQRSPVPLVLSAVLVGCLALLSEGCVYRINVQQGNFLEAKLVDQVTVGMTRSQVRFLLGTPMLADSFHPDRWDYLYYFKLGKTQKVTKHEFVVYFTDEKVARIDRPLGSWEDPKVPTSPGA